MGSLILDDLDSATLDGLRRRAVAARRSVEEEARAILQDAAAVTGELPAAVGREERRRAFLAGIDSIRADTRGRATTDPVALLREDRDR